jgi:hypothetical protein
MKGLKIVTYYDVFRYADVGQPGGLSNAEIFFRSELCNFLCTKLLPEEYHLIAGSSFPLQKWLMTPFPSNISKDSMHKRFDYRLYRATTPIEIAFAHLRGRWKILLKRCDLQLDNMINIIKTCLVLHNLCESSGDHYFDLWDENVNEERKTFSQPLHVENLASNSEQGFTKRNELAIIVN